MNMQSTTGVVLALSLAGAVTAEPLFEEVSAEAGIQYVGQSWGSAWGDFNGDGWYDLWTTNHGAPPHLYLNQGDGTFVDVAASVVPAEVWTYYQTTVGGYDAHGALWTDIDRDGDVDLVQGADGNSRSHANHLLVNDGGVTFSAEVGDAAGIALPENATRKPVALDWNADGYADLFTSASKITSFTDAMTFHEADHGSGSLSYLDMTDTFSVATNSPLVVGFIGDLDDDHRLEIVAGPTPNFVSVFEFDQGQPAEITAELGLLGTEDLVDGVAADFDGDGDLDLYAVRGERPRDLVQRASNTIEATVYPRASEEGVRFSSDGDVTFSIYPAYQLSSQTIYIGSAGTHPEPVVVSQGYQVTLSSSDSANHGIFSHIPGGNYGHYIGYDPDTSTWSLLVSASGSAQRNLVISSTGTIDNVEAIGFTAGAEARDDLYFRNDGGQFVAAAQEAGFEVSTSARSVVAGDFDNDADMDIYAVSTGPVVNNPNVLYLNDGSGRFTRAVTTGAEGPVDGRGDSVSMADYDNDGFLDLFVSNGKDKAPYYYDGPYVLFRNLGNDNHWLQLDLTGTVSEIQGIGAKISLTTASGTQVRLHGNTNNARSQHMTRSHFGLGSATVIDEIHIDWPSGRQQKLHAVAADQILAVTEPETQSDADSDGVLDALDNCLTAPNASQLDVDGDGYGNACDGDFDNDCAVNFADLALLKQAFLGSDPVYDLDGDGATNFADLAAFKALFLAPPGPSGTSLFCQ